MKTNKYKILLLMVFITTLVGAQGNRPFPNVDEMHNRKFQFISDKVHLSPKDIEGVKPVFLEYEKALWSLHEKNGEFFKSLKDRQKNAPINFSDMNDRYVDTEVNKVQLFKNYHLKLRKILAPETLFRYYGAEREYKRELLQDFQDRPQHGGKPTEQKR
jgi:hypothetical protein